MKVKDVWKFQNNMVMVLDENGSQISELQGEYTMELLKQIINNSDTSTVFNGLDKPIKWTYRGGE